MRAIRELTIKWLLENGAKGTATQLRKWLTKERMEKTYDNEDWLSATLNEWRSNGRD